MKKQHIKLSSVVTPVSLPKGFYDDDKNTKRDFSIEEQVFLLEFFLNSLISCSASKIYILSESLTPQVIDALPNFIKPKIMWVDRKEKIRKQVIHTIYPIYNELHWLWAEKRKIDPKAHEHGVCILLENLHILANAIKYKAEADVNFDFIKQAVNRIKNQITSREAVAILARLEGIINAFSQRETIDSLYINPDIHVTTPGDLLVELLNDAEYIELSEARYLLGVPKMINTSINKIKFNIHRLLKDKKIKYNLKIAKQAVNIATEAFKIPFKIPEISASTHEYTPPLVSLDKFRNPCMICAHLKYPDDEE